MSSVPLKKDTDVLRGLRASDNMGRSGALEPPRDVSVRIRKIECRALLLLLADASVVIAAPHSRITCALNYESAGPLEDGTWGPSNS
jgi:hypothetical protein